MSLNPMTHRNLLAFLSTYLLALLVYCKPIDDPWLNIFPAQNPPKVIKFAGLELSIDDKALSCIEKEGSLFCPLDINSELCSLSFEKKSINGTTSLPLLRLMRKKEWQSRYNTVNQYKEIPFETGLGKLFGQSAIVYRFDNIQWPVLLRAIDVVIDDKTCISISTKCSLDRWSLKENEVMRLLGSLKKAAKK